MTRELGISNAYNKCHGDQTVDWAVEHAEAWHGEKLASSRQRQHARTLHAAYEGDTQAVEPLLELVSTYEYLGSWKVNDSPLA